MLRPFEVIFRSKEIVDIFHKQTLESIDHPVEFVSEKRQHSLNQLNTSLFMRL